MKQSQAIPLAVGTPAPGFNLADAPGQQLSLADFRGQPVVLVFYPADFEPVTNNELAIFNEILPELQRHEAQVLGISADNVWSHLAYMKKRNLHFPLLADFNPKGAVARDYHAYSNADGQTTRAIYVVDSGGLVAWSYIAPKGVSPGADGALLAVEQLDQALSLGL